MGLLSFFQHVAVPAPPDNLPADLQSAVDGCREHYGVPAMGAAVITADSVEVAVSGVRRAGSQDSVSVDDLWHLGSNAKAMTATLAGVLVEQGRLDPELQLSDAKLMEGATLHSGYRDVTLVQLLQHRAGVQAFTSGLEGWDMPELTGSGAEQRLAFARYLLARKPHRIVGEYEYSNAGYGIAAAVCEQATGQPWDALLRELVMEPLGADFSVGWPGADGTPQPWGHVYSWRRLVPQDPQGEYQLEPSIEPAGDVSMSLPAYAKFVQLHLRGLQGMPAAGAATESQLPSPGMIKMLHEPDGDYACGWIVREIEGEMSSAHEGSTGTFHALVILQPARNIAVAVVTNAGGERPAEATRELSKALLRGAKAEAAP